MSGFSLIEMLIYIAVLALALVVIVVSMAGFAKTYTRIEAHQVLARSGSYAMERLVREARDAQSVEQTLSTFGTHPGSVGFVTTIGTGVTRTSEFFIDAGSLVVAHDGTTIGALTGPDVVVEGFVVDRIDTTHGEAVRVRLTLSKALATSTVTTSFYGTAALRGAYAL